VFARFDGSAWRPSYLSHRLRLLAVEAGLPPIKLHEARHTRISLMSGSAPT
jgi:hypothetical protein